MAWDLVDKEETNRLDAANSYNQVEALFRQKHPEWFADTDAVQSSGKENEEQTPASRADLASLTAQVESLSQRLDTIGQGLKFLGARTGWIWWFSLGALVASLIAR